MELILEPQAEPFKIKVGFFDTILQMKEEIEKDTGIPVSMQTLIFKGDTLADDADIGKYGLDDGSHVQLLIAADFIKNLPVNMEELSPAPSNVKTPSSNIRTLQMDAKDTVLKRKERFEEIESVPMPVPVPVKGIGNTNDGGAGVSRKLMTVIVQIAGARKITMVVNPSDKVGELRKELQRLNQGGQLLLPSEYFFMREQYLMFEDESYLWHKVAPGDTISLIKGRPAAGPSG